MAKKVVNKQVYGMTKVNSKIIAEKLFKKFSAIKYYHEIESEIIELSIISYQIGFVILIILQFLYVLHRLELIRQ